MTEFKEWIQPVPTDRNKAFCRYCKSEIRAKLYDLKQHFASTKHIAASHPFSSKRQTQINFKPINEITNSKKAEAKLALYIATHSSIMNIDHLSQLCNNTFSLSDSKTDLHLHRTKCKGLIVNILGPHFSESLVKDIGEQKFSLIIDESTDISVSKLLAVSVRYYSTQMNEIVSTFLGIVELEKCDATSIVVSLKQLLLDLKLNPKKVQGLGTDNASVMCGVNNGVYVKMKTEFDNNSIVLMRCVCHSLQLALSHATEETLPRNIEFLIRETYKWFSCSTQRRLEYKQIYNTINCDKGERDPHNIPEMCNTRWISIEPAINRILEQYTELTLHFQLARRKAHCYTAELLYNMYKDPVNKVYLYYIQTIVNELQKTNKLFESENVDPTKLLDSLANLVQSISGRIINPTAKIDPLKCSIDNYIDPHPYLGYSVENELKLSNLSEDVNTNLRERCVNFTKKLVQELQNRLPDNLEVLRKMSILSVKETLKTVKQPITDLAIALGFEEHIDKIENQWRNISYIKWMNETSTPEFWQEVSQYTDAGGQTPFSELVSLAFSVLTLPHSNAEVERIFSQVNIVKNKLRNRLKTDTLSAILSVRFGLRRQHKCCFSYEVPGDILRLVGTNAAYTRDTGENVCSTSSRNTADEDDDDDIYFN